MPASIESRVLRLEQAVVQLQYLCLSDASVFKSSDEKRAMETLQSLVSAMVADHQA